MTTTESTPATRREIQRLVSGHQTMDGAGVRLVRVLGSGTVTDFDPFLMLDAFDSTNPADYTRGFPMHPHRGIETVTYLVEGSLEHKDSLGNSGLIVSGGCQWMTAGRGILHQEMPQASPRMLGLQLWVNLPKAHKMAPPEYREVTPDTLPRVAEDGVRVAILSGEYQGRSGAVQPGYVPVTFLEVLLEPGKTCHIPTNPEDTVFAYLFHGDCRFGEKGTEFTGSRKAALFYSGAYVSATGGTNGAHFVLVSGKPLREPVAWGGPIVMNTDEELRQAFFELENGTFITS